jgi:hypothetical protein
MFLGSLARCSGSAIALATLLGSTVFLPSPATAASVGADWWDQVRRDITLLEYQVSRQDPSAAGGVPGEFHAPNRAHDFRIFFAEDGVRIIPRTEPLPSWSWGLAPTAWGRGTESEALAAALIAIDRNRVDYDRGPVREWYVNSPDGLKQGFVLSRPPAADSSDSRQPAHLDMRLLGTLLPLISEDGGAIDFETADGARVIHYAGLGVFDAAGRILEARMRAISKDAGPVVRLEFDDRDAVYPVTIDPLATSPAWTVEANEVGAGLGFSVGTAGDVNADGYADIIVGAYLFDGGTNSDNGRAFAFYGGPSGPATVADWFVDGANPAAALGVSVGTAGDVNGDGYSDVIVGAYQDVNGEVNEGRAFVYHGSATGLSATANWKAEGNQAEARFGFRVATAGDVNGDGFSDVIVGAPYFDNGETDEGRAFVFHGSASGLSTSANWTAEGNQVSANFGIAVSAAGDVNGNGYGDVIVGAQRYDNGQTDEGRAFVFHGSAPGLSTTANWTAESDQAGSEFGRAAANAGDVNGDGYADVIVGAPLYDNGQTDEGRAYAYLGSATGLSATSAWTVESNQASAKMGWSAASAGDTNGDGYADVIVGAPYFDNGQADEGRAYAYSGSASGLGASPSWTAESNSLSAEFGWAVATAGDVNGDGYADVIVGADAFSGGDANEGKAYAYLGSAAGLSSGAGWTNESNQATAYLGASVAAAGDVNGDGYGDVIVGAPSFDNGQTDEGRAFAFHGSATGLSTTANWTAESNQASALFGGSVAGAGDVNGDGYDDVIVGAKLFDNVETDEGRAFVYHGSSAGLSTTANWTGEPNQANAQYGTAVAGAGDVNGDGFADVIVGAPLFDNGQTDEGRAFAYHGSSTGLAATANWTSESNQANAQYGASVAGAGDVNRDGFGDVMIGAPLFDNVEADEGRAFAYHGSSTGLTATASWTSEPNQANAQHGATVASAGDVNGDGYSDAIVGAPLFDNGETDEGRASVYPGSPTGLAASASWTAESNQIGAQFGCSVATAGDFDANGFSDVLVGARLFDNVETDEGRAYAYRGSASGPALTPSWTAEANQIGADFGASVSGAGDVNGDGFADVVVGARLLDNVETDEGRAFVYLGNGGGGLSLKPQQRRVSNTVPIALRGVSDAGDGFRVAATGRSPFGRGKVKLQTEAKPLGTPFDGTGLQTSASWIDSDVAGAALNERLTGLAGSTMHSWRARVVYSGATTPYQQASRWFTVPSLGSLEGRVRTSTCTLPLPTGSSTITEGKNAGTTTISWTSLPNASVYDLVRGNLSTLRSSAGDFSAATESCLADNEAATTFTDGTIPAAGSGFYYLVRGVNCAGNSSYDEGNPKQQGSRDAETNASANSCP